MPAAKTKPAEADPEDRIAALEALVRQQSKHINALQATPVGSRPDYPEPLGLSPKSERQAHGREIVAEWEREAREAEKDTE